VAVDGSASVYVVDNGNQRVEKFVSTVGSVTALTTSPNPSLVGQTVTLTAAVTPSLATGTVTFRDGVTTIGSPVPLNGAAIATLNVSTLTAGNHLLTPTQALGYVRARYTLGNGSDLERIGRQQAFMSSLVSRVTACPAAASGGSD